MTQPTSAEQWLDLIEKRAKGLREAGVKRIELDGCKVDLAPTEPDVGGLFEKEQPTEPLDPLDDPATYGRRDVPTLRRRAPEDELA